MPPPLSETPEQKVERLAKRRAARKEKIANETAEERRKRLDKKNARRQKKLLEETPEERQKRLEKTTTRRRKFRAKDSEEERTNRVKEETAKARRRRLQRFEEKKNHEDHLEKQKFYRLVKSVTMTEEEREEKRRKNYFYRQANKWRFARGNLPEEERQRQRDVHNKWKNSLTGEKKQRHLESVARALRKSQRKILDKLKQDPKKWLEYKLKRAEYQRERYANETLEQRVRRRRKDLVNLARGKLRKKLREENVSSEEIEKQLLELKEQMWKSFYPDGNAPLPEIGRRGPPRKTFDVVPTTPSTSMESNPAKEEEICLGNQIEEDDDVSSEFAPISEQLWSITPEHSPPPTPSPLMEMVKVEYEDIVIINTTEDVIEDPFGCSHCSLKFSTDAQFRFHLLSEHSEKCWKCPKCSEVVLTPFELSQHFESTHKASSVQNKIQSSDFIKPQQQKSPDKQWNFLCVKCPYRMVKKFKTRVKLFAHVKQCHAGNYWPCKDCQLLKYSEESLNLHRSICSSFSET